MGFNGNIFLQNNVWHVKTCTNLNLGQCLCIFTFFLSQHSGLYLLNGCQFHDSKNQQLVLLMASSCSCVVIIL